MKSGRRVKRIRRQARMLTVDPAAVQQVYRRLKRQYTHGGKQGRSTFRPA